MVPSVSAQYLYSILYIFMTNEYFIEYGSFVSFLLQKRQSIFSALRRTQNFLSK